MAIQSKRNFLGAMRIDTNMLRAIESGVVSDFGTLINSVLTSGDPSVQTYVVRGFTHTGTTRSSFTISLADSVFLSQNSGRSMFVFPSDVEDVTPFVNEVSNTYYWGFRVAETDAIVQPFAFKDPITNVEYTKTVPTAKELAYIEPYYDTEGTRSDVTFIYKITVSGNTVTVNGLADATGNETQYFLTFNGNHYDSLTEWAAAVQQAGSAVTMGGDVDGQSDDATVVGLQGKPFEGTPTNGQVPVYSTADGGKWVFGASNAVASATFYVATDGSDTTGNGSLTAPFATIAKAQDEVDGLTGDVFAAIELLPGTYVEDVTIYRHNLILRGLQASSRGLSHKILGSVTVDCATATQKYNDVVAIQGLFIEPSAIETAAVHVTGSGLFSVLIDNCYLTTDDNDGTSNALLVDNDNVDRVRVSVSNSILTIQTGGPDIISLEHGDVRLDSCELYFASSVTAGTVSGAIVIDGDASLAADRILVDVSSGVEAIHVTGGTVWPKLTLSNSSVSNGYDGASSHCIYMDITEIANVALFSWQNILSTSNSSASAIINNTGTTAAIITHGQTTFGLNAVGATNSKITNCFLLPMKETHGDLVIPSQKAAAGTYALTIDMDGNVGSQVFPTGDVASVGNVVGDTSITVAGTGSGPYTGAVTVKLPDVVTAGTVGTNGVTIPVMGYDKYGRITSLTPSPLNIEYTTGQYKTVKDYVDDLAFGLSGKDPVAAATTAALVDEYDVSPDGLVLTKKTGNGALGAIDGVTPTVGMRLLIKDEPATPTEHRTNNGIYTVTVVGNGTTKWQLTRAADANTPTSLCGALVPVSVAGSPNTNGGSLWTFAKNPSGFTIGTSVVTFTSITATTPNATTSTTGKVQLAGALGGTGTSATAPVVDLGTDGNFSGTLSLSKVKGPSNDKAVAISSGANAWSATGLTGTSKLVGFIADGTPTAITLGTNLSFSGSTLNAVLSSAVSSIASSDSTINVSSSTGDVNITLPQSVATSATPTFAGLTINSNGVTTAVTLGVGTGVNRINTLEMNTASTWYGVFGGEVRLNSTNGIHLNTDLTNGGNVTLSKSGSTTTVGGALTLPTIKGGYLKSDASTGAVTVVGITSADVSGTFPASSITNIPYDISGEVFGAPPANGTAVYHYRAPRKFRILFDQTVLESGIACGVAPSASGTNAFVVKKYNPAQSSSTILFRFGFASGSKNATVTLVGSSGDFNIEVTEHIFVETSEVPTGLQNVWFTFAGAIT